MAERKLIDEKNEKILTILQDNARTSNSEIARRMGMATSGIYERIRKMEERGIIAGYTVKINPEAAGVPLVAFVNLQFRPHRAAHKVGETLATIPGIEEIHLLTGDESFFVKIRCRDTEALEKILLQVNDIEEVFATKTSLALRSFKESAGILMSSRSGGSEG